MTTEKKRYPERSRVGGILTRCVGIFLLILVIFLLGDNILREIDNRLSAVVLRRSDCLEHLSGLSRDLGWYSLAHPEAITPDRTVSDVIQAAMRDREIDGNHLLCARDGRSYLVFPAPASVLRLEREMEHIPIVMDRPDAHEEGAFVTMAYRVFRDNDPAKACVLYSDGTLEVISRAEAEKLVSAHSPVPLELDPEVQNEAKP